MPPGPSLLPLPIPIVVEEFWGGLKNDYKLLNLTALKVSPLNKIYTSFNEWVTYFEWNSNVTFEIPHKTSYPYIARIFF